MLSNNKGLLPPILSNIQFTGTYTTLLTKVFIISAYAASALVAV